MANKNVTIWIGNVSDAVTNITIPGSPAYSAASVTALVSSNPTIFSLQSNQNGQTDLKFQLDTGTPYIIGQFTESGTSNAYGAQTWDYIGGQPIKRCPQCP